MEPPAASPEPTPAAPPAPTLSTHIVAPGDCLYSIATAHGVTLSTVLQADAFADSTAVIQPGQVLVIPLAGGDPAVAPVPHPDGEGDPQPQRRRGQRRPLASGTFSASHVAAAAAAHTALAPTAVRAAPTTWASTGLLRGNEPDDRPTPNAIRCALGAQGRNGSRRVLPQPSLTGHATDKWRDAALYAVTGHAPRVLMPPPMHAYPLPTHAHHGPDASGTCGGPASAQLQPKPAFSKHPSMRYRRSPSGAGGTLRQREVIAEADPAFVHGRADAIAPAIGRASAHVSVTAAARVAVAGGVRARVRRVAGGVRVNARVASGVHVDARVASDIRCACVLRVNAGVNGGVRGAPGVAGAVRGAATAADPRERRTGDQASETNDLSDVSCDHWAREATILRATASGGNAEGGTLLSC